jgi:hypothetical protein
MASQRQFAGCPTLQCIGGSASVSAHSIGTNTLEGFERTSYTLDEINCVYVIVEENGTFQVLPPAIVPNPSQTKVAEFGTVSLALIKNFN